MRKMLLAIAIIALSSGSLLAMETSGLARISIDTGSYYGAAVLTLGALPGGQITDNLIITATMGLDFWNSVQAGIYRDDESHPFYPDVLISRRSDFLIIEISQWGSVAILPALRSDRDSLDSILPAQSGSFTRFARIYRADNELRIKLLTVTWSPGHPQ